MLTPCHSQYESGATENKGIHVWRWSCVISDLIVGVEREGNISVVRDNKVDMSRCSGGCAKMSLRARVEGRERNDGEKGTEESG